MGKSGGAISPTATVVIIVVAVIVILAGGLWFMNKPAKDTIADAVKQQRGAAGATANGPAPMGGVAPKPGASDYANPNPMPSAPARR
jgi:cell division protein FtsN